MQTITVLSSRNQVKIFQLYVQWIIVTLHYQQSEGTYFLSCVCFGSMNFYLGTSFLVYAYIRDQLKNEEINFMN